MKKTKTDLGKLFNPASVAVIGATEKEGKVGYAVSKNILELGYGGKVFFVNTKYDKLFGRKCYESLESVPDEVDLAIVIVPAPFVNGIIREGSQKTKNFVIISAGFSETGGEGLERERELENIVAEKEINVLGPNCLGFINPSLKLNASFAGGMPREKNVAFVSQSGALAVAFLDRARRKNIGFSKIISVGNKVQIDETLLLEYLAEDEATETIAFYLEGIKRGPEFIRAAKRASRKKPVIILKSGRSERAQKAIASHTGALAGSDGIMDAVFEKSGVIRADTTDQFFALVDLCSNPAWRTAKNIGSLSVVTNAGGPGVLTADAFQGKDVRLAEMSSKTKKSLREFLPAEASVENPIDLLGDATEERYRSALKTVAGERSSDAVLVLLTPQDQTPVRKIAEAVADIAESGPRPIAASFIGGGRVEKEIDFLRSRGVVHFDFPELAVDAIHKLVRGRRRSGEKIVEMEIDRGRAEKASRIIHEAKSEGRKALLFDEARKIFAIYGLGAVESWTVLPGQDLPAGISYPCVAKIDSDKVLHKTDKKGLILGIENRKSLEKSTKELQENFPDEKIVIQPMLDIKTELIIGVKRDPVFGPIVLAGLGGIYTEIFKMVDFFVPPVSLDGIKRILEEGKIGFLFRETRGQAPYDLEEVSDIVFKLSRLASEVGEIKEIDINPLLVYNDGRPAVAVDIKIIFPRS